MATGGKALFATNTEIDTFKVMSNVDFVDWTRAARLSQQSGGAEPVVVLEAVEDSPVQSPPQSPPHVERERSRSRSPSSSASSVSAERPAFVQPERSFSPESPPHVSPPSSPHSVRDAPAKQPSPSPPREQPQPFKRTMPKPKQYTAAEENEDYEMRAEKEALLNEILSYERPPYSIRLTRVWSVDEHTLDQLQYELDRIQSELNANQMVEFAKTGIKMGVGGLEAFLKNSGLQAVDGWYKNSCADMNKYNRPLLKIYKRYYRKVSMSPMTELGFLLFGGLAYTVAQNKIMGGGRPAAPRAEANSSGYPEGMGLGSRPDGSQVRAADQPAMRPPSVAGVRGPRWTNMNADTPVQTPSPAVQQTPVAPPESETLKLLRGMQESQMKFQADVDRRLKEQERRSIASSRTSSASSVTSERSQSLRIAFGNRKKPASARRPGTARSTRDAGGMLKL